ncbi:site-specific integrase [Ferruginibacter paludis]|uniref:site-specific integrase n=1 Tax=Ferruginibacter paludis TaxID=1310417 RepID=UPI0025B395D7|nr:site-specific integrase [Ferruginibacter paludis]MDN3657948.1 site-specific integrase [Ferruginibacter paludis]
MGTIRFTLRNDKQDSKGLAPVELVYQISGQRKYFRTREKLHVENWNDVEQLALYLDRKTAKKLLPGIDYDLLPAAKEVDEINNRLNAIRKDIADIEKRFELNRVTYSAEMVVTSLKENRSPLTKKEAPTNQLFEFIDKYITDHRETREPGSLAVYKTLKNHLQAFQIARKKKITFNTVDYNFFMEFQNFLISDQKLNNVTTAKNLSTVKTFLSYAKTQGIAISEKYKDFKIKKEKSLEVIALTQSEFNALYNLDLSGKQKLDQVRDVFCFSTATGLRYSDLFNLKREHIGPGEIRFTVKKTKEPLMVPLTPVSKSILNKYRDLVKPLPVISNQKTNKYLKEVCELAGIDSPVQIVRFRGVKKEEQTFPKYKLITIHVARKSFCTLSLKKGISAEEVMRISGHSDYRSFQRYISFTEDHSKTVMAKAWGKLPPKLKAV